MMGIKTGIKKVLPKVAIERLRDFRSYPFTERVLYFKMRVLEQLRIAPKRAPIPARSFLFVCYGNIMRSPMCEALMNRAVAGLNFSQAFRVMSAGLNVTPGRAAHPWAIEAAHEFGICLENHRARRLTSEMIEQSDAILAMDYQNHVQLLSRYPRSGRKVFFLGAYAEHEHQDVEIRDPYTLDRDATSACYRLINVCITELVRYHVNCMVSEERYTRKPTGQ